MRRTPEGVGAMPKETIYSEYSQVLDEQTGGFKYPHEPLVEVGWTKGNSVEVSVVLARHEELKESAIPVAPNGGYTANLSRDGLNRLIRALRKARDRAFGADA